MQVDSQASVVQKKQEKKPKFKPRLPVPIPKGVPVIGKSKIYAYRKLLHIFLGRVPSLPNDE